LQVIQGDMLIFICVWMAGLAASKAQAGVSKYVPSR
jgi:hypothetical protein